MPILEAVFAWARAAGFDGCELSTAHQDFATFSDDELDEVASALADAGLEAAAYNPGGFRLTGKRASPAHLRSVMIAARLGASTINLTLPGERSFDNAAGIPSEYLVGSGRPLGSGQERPERDWIALAAVLGELADTAARVGITISLEIHQNSFIEDSAAALKMLALVDRENVGLNPDLGNILWAAAIPTESSEDAIAKLAQHAVYVHCKNMRRVFMPGIDRAAFVRTSLLERGDIDWRWALAELAAKGYQGYLTCEGDYAEGWDFRKAMERNAVYLRELLTSPA